MSTGFFYLSFVDESRPVGDRFVGATIINADDAVSAVDTARARGLVPKGVQIAMVELYTQDDANLRITTLDMLPPESARLLWGRIATKAEIEAEGRPLTEADMDAFVCKDHAEPDMKLKRPHVPIAVKIKVAERQLSAALAGDEERASWVAQGLPMAKDKNRYLRFLLQNLLGDEPWVLDHEPPLALRDRTMSGDYLPDAVDADWLIWRTKADHDRKTRHRGDHGQHSDLALIRRQKRRKARKAGEAWSGWDRSGETRRGPVRPAKGAGRKKPAPKRRWPSRPMRGRPP